MRKLTVLGVVVAAFLAPAAARAQFTLGARLSYAIPGGSAFKDDTGAELKMSDGFASNIPLELDLGWNLSPDVNLGVYIGYGWTQLASKEKDACSAGGLSCSAHQVRYGIQGTWTFNKVTGVLVPWVGLGTGWESLSEKGDVAGSSVTVTLTGWEMLNLQLGADVRSEGKFRWGPFVAYSFGQFGKAKAESGGVSASADVPSKTTHTYLQFGIRGNWGF